MVSAFGAWLSGFFGSATVRGNPQPPSASSSPNNTPGLGAGATSRTLHHHPQASSSPSSEQASTRWSGRLRRGNPLPESPDTLKRSYDALEEIRVANRVMGSRKSRRNAGEPSRAKSNIAAFAKKPTKIRRGRNGRWLRSHTRTGLLATQTPVRHYRRHVRHVQAPPPHAEVNGLTVKKKTSFSRVFKTANAIKREVVSPRAAETPKTKITKESIHPSSNATQGPGDSCTRTIIKKEHCSPQLSSRVLESLVKSKNNGASKSGSSSILGDDHSTPSRVSHTRSRANTESNSRRTPRQTFPHAGKLPAPQNLPAFSSPTVGRTTRKTRGISSLEGTESSPQPEQKASLVEMRVLESGREKPDTPRNSTKNRQTRATPSRQNTDPRPSRTGPTQHNSSDENHGLPLSKALPEPKRRKLAAKRPHANQNLEKSGARAQDSSELPSEPDSIYQQSTPKSLGLRSGLHLEDLQKGPDSIAIHPEPGTGEMQNEASPVDLQRAPGSINFPSSINIPGSINILGSELSSISKKNSQVEANLWSHSSPRNDAHLSELPSSISSNIDVLEVRSTSGSLSMPNDDAVVTDPGTVTASVSSSSKSPNSGVQKSQVQSSPNPFLGGSVPNAHSSSEPPVSSRKKNGLRDARTNAFNNIAPVPTTRVSEEVIGDLVAPDTDQSSQCSSDEYTYLLTTPVNLQVPTSESPQVVRTYLPSGTDASVSPTNRKVQSPVYQRNNQSNDISHIAPFVNTSLFVENEDFSGLHMPIRPASVSENEPIYVLDAPSEPSLPESRSLAHDYSLIGAFPFHSVPARSTPFSQPLPISQMSPGKTADTENPLMLPLSHGSASIHNADQSFSLISEKLFVSNSSLCSPSSITTSAREYDPVPDSNLMRRASVYDGAYKTDAVPVMDTKKDSGSEGVYESGLVSERTNDMDSIATQARASKTVTGDPLVATRLPRFSASILQGEVYPSLKKPVQPKTAQQASSDVAVQTYPQTAVRKADEASTSRSAQKPPHAPLRDHLNDQPMEIWRELDATRYRFQAAPHPPTSHFKHRATRPPTVVSSNIPAAASPEPVLPPTLQTTPRFRALKNTTVVSRNGKRTLQFNLKKTGKRSSKTRVPSLPSTSPHQNLSASHVSKAPTNHALSGRAYSSSSALDSRGSDSP